MKTILINHSVSRVSKKFISSWVTAVSRTLTKSKYVKNLENKELIVVLVDANEMLQMNTTYRGKKYATDVLSFVSDDSGALGELVLCPQVIKKQSFDHKLSYNEEMGYMLLHGILHLLGYDHEKSAVAARKMFQIQDDVFEILCKSLIHVSTSRSQRRKKKTRKLTKSNR